MRIAHIAVLLALACVGCKNAEHSPGETALVPQYEYQVRLDPAKFVNREEAVIALHAWLLKLSQDHTVEGLEFEGRPLEDRPLKRVDYFDTDDAALEQRGLRLRRREVLGTTAGDYTLKANARTPEEAMALHFARDQPGFDMKSKLEQDIYAQSEQTKWGYSVSFERAKGAGALLPAASDINSLAILARWFPDAARSLDLPGETKLAGTTEFHWSGRFELQLGNAKMDLELLLPYATRDQAEHGGVRAIEPELAWKSERREAIHTQFQEAIQATWGELKLD